MSPSCLSNLGELAGKLDLEEGEEFLVNTYKNEDGRQGGQHSRGCVHQLHSRGL